MTRLQRHSNMWLIEQRDVGIVHLITNYLGETPSGILVEHRISNEDVGMVYIVDKKGDRIEFAPLDSIDEHASAE